MSHPLTRFIPHHFPTLAGLASGRPDVAMLHLEAQSGARRVTEGDPEELRAGVIELHSKAVQLCEERSGALGFVDRALGEAGTS